MTELLQPQAGFASDARFVYTITSKGEKVTPTDFIRKITFSKLPNTAYNPTQPHKLVVPEDFKSSIHAGLNLRSGLTSVLIGWGTTRLNSPSLDSIDAFRLKVNSKAVLTLDGIVAPNSFGDAPYYERAKVRTASEIICGLSRAWTPFHKLLPLSASASMLTLFGIDETDEANAYTLTLTDHPETWSRFAMEISQWDLIPLLLDLHTLTEAQLPAYYLAHGDTLRCVIVCMMLGFSLVRSEGMVGGVLVRTLSPVGISPPNLSASPSPVVYTADGVAFACYLSQLIIQPLAELLKPVALNARRMALATDTDINILREISKIMSNIDITYQSHADAVTHMKALITPDTNVFAVEAVENVIRQIEAVDSPKTMVMWDLQEMEKHIVDKETKLGKNLIYISNDGEDHAIALGIKDGIFMILSHVSTDFTHANIAETGELVLLNLADPILTLPIDSDGVESLIFYKIDHKFEDITHLFGVGQPDFMVTYTTLLGAPKLMTRHITPTSLPKVMVENIPRTGQFYRYLEPTRGGESGALLTSSDGKILGVHFAAETGVGFSDSDIEKIQVLTP